jgi:hypothetical protein
VDVSGVGDTGLFSDERGRCKHPAQSFYEHIFAHNRFVMLLTITLRLLFHPFLPLGRQKCPRKSLWNSFFQSISFSLGLYS